MNTKSSDSDIDFLKSFSLDTSTKQKLIQYIDIIIDYKNKLNLVGESDKESIIQNLLIPSIISTELVDRKNLIDIGSGSGVLGIPIKLVINNVRLIICEKNLKIFLPRDTMFVPIKRVLVNISIEFFSGSNEESTTLS